MPLTLEAKTLDRVVPDDQLSESTHNLQGQQTNAGGHRGYGWRDASNWFSYDLKDATKQAAKLRALYYGLDTGRTFEVWVNGRLVATEILANKGDIFYIKDYSLPADLVSSSNGVFKAEFRAKNGSTAGGLFGLRLMKN